MKASIQALTCIQNKEGEKLYVVEISNAGEILKVFTNKRFEDPFRAILYKHKKELIVFARNRPHAKQLAQVIFRYSKHF